MKKSAYISPALRQKNLDFEETFLASGSDYSPSSTLEGFEETDDAIVW